MLENHNKDNFLTAQEGLLRGCVAATLMALGYRPGPGAPIEEVIFDKYPSSKYSKRAAEILRVTGIYRLQNTQDNGYIMVNRDYKPIGFAPINHLLAYKDYPSHIFPSEIVDKIVAKRQKLEHSPLYFYSDSTAPWLGASHAREYLLKLLILCNLLFPTEKIYALMIMKLNAVKKLKTIKSQTY